MSRADRERAALLLLDQSMEKYEIGRDEVEPLVAMKLAVLLDDTSEPEENPYSECAFGCCHLEPEA